MVKRPIGRYPCLFSKSLITRLQELEMMEDAGWNRHYPCLDISAANTMLVRRLIVRGKIQQQARRNKIYNMVINKIKFSPGGTK